MKAKQILLLVTCAAGLPACAVQGEQSITPTGVTVNQSARLGAHAFAPNPFKQQPVINEAPTHVTNNYYTAERVTETRYVQAPDPTIVVVPTF
jgi:hypothetical protein